MWKKNLLAVAASCSCAFDQALHSHTVFADDEGVLLSDTHLEARPLLRGDDAQDYRGKRHKEELNVHFRKSLIRLLLEVDVVEFCLRYFSHVLD